MKSISYSAPAKVILSGEHAVVYGKPALVAALNSRLSFRVAEGKGKEDKNIRHIAETVIGYLKRKNIPLENKPYTYWIRSSIPVGRGLGSSAALSVAASASFLHYFTGKKPDLETIANVSYDAEKLFHARPSGVDTSASTYGGLIYFRKEFEFLKTISSLHLKIPSHIEQNLLLIDSGKSVESTALMVERVGYLYNSHPKEIEQCFLQIEKTTKRMVVSFAKEDKLFFRNALLDNQKELVTLGIVSQKAKALLASLEPYGVGKITGAGGYSKGSGYILFYADLKEETLDILNKNKTSHIPFTLSHVGVKEEVWE